MKCAKCNKEGAYLRFKRQEVICRNCGYIGKMKTGKQAHTQVLDDSEAKETL